MDDEEFLIGFEDCTFPAAGFHHREHVRVVWLYLHRYPMLQTIAKFSESLKRFATANGKPDLYHETITWAYVFLINERLERDGQDETWTAFAERNADLLNWKHSVLKSYYREETLGSDLARKRFVFPDNFCPSPFSS